MKRLVVPKFSTEAEEVKWWHDHRDVIEANLMQAMKEGTAHRGGPLRALEEVRESKNITIRISVADIKRAQGLAAKKGIGYQTYMKMLLREALDREERQARRKAG
jgi:predicted DNA binding CopG/RHH family protein